MGCVGFRLALTVATLVMLVGCGLGASAETPTPTVAANLTDEEIIQRAQQAAAAVTTYRYVWDMERREVAPDGEVSGLVLHEEGRWSAPGDFFADSVLGDGERRYQEISVDGATYIRYLPGDGWSVHSPSQYRGPPEVPDSVEWQVVDRDATFDGQPAYRLLGTRELVEDGLRSTKRRIDAYVGKDDFLPMFVDTRSELQTTTESGTSSFVLTSATRYFAHDEPVTIEPPPDATPAR